MSLILDKKWSNPDEIIATDACPQSGGGYTNDEYFSENFPDECRDSPIHIKEFLTLLVAVKTWGSVWSRKRILIHCDNQSVCHAINGNKPDDPKLQELLRELVFFESIYSFKIGAVYIETKANHLADYLSRITSTEEHLRYFQHISIPPKTRISIPPHNFLKQNKW